MPDITFSAEDFKAKMQVPGAWYETKIKSVKEKPGKTNADSITYHIEFQIMEGDAADVTCMGFYNNGVPSQMGDLLNLFKCFTAVEKGKAYKAEDLTNRPVRAYCFYNMDMTMNMVKDFMPSKKVAA